MGIKLATLFGAGAAAESAIAFYAVRNTELSLTSGTNTAFACQNEIVDTNGQYNTSTGDWTVTSATQGEYLVFTYCIFSNKTDGAWTVNDEIRSLLMNDTPGVEAQAFRKIVGVDSNNNIEHAMLSIYPLTATSGDVYNAGARINVSNKTLMPNSYFGAFKYADLS